MSRKVWSSMEDVFSCLGKNDIYVILTGDELLRDGFKDFGYHHDIDMLVVNHRRTIDLLGADCYYYYSDEHYRVNLNGKPATLGIYELGDDYMDSRWQKEMLEKRNLDSDGHYVIDAENHLYWMMYHALCQKRVFPEHYRKRIEYEAREFGIEATTENQMWGLLEDFLFEKGYGCPYPKVFLERVYAHGFKSIKPTGYNEWHIKRAMNIPIRVIRKLYRHHIRNRD